MKRVLLSLVFIVALSAAASAQSFTYYFPQVAVGAGWRTTVFLSNATAGAASGTVTFTQNDGTAFASNWTDESGNNVTGGGNKISFSLGSGESRKFVSVDDRPLTAGYAM